MKYIVRSLKYYCYLLLLLVIIIAALVLTGFVEADLSKMFVNGYDSLWQIAYKCSVFYVILVPLKQMPDPAAVVPREWDNFPIILN